MHTSYKKSSFGTAFLFLPHEKREALGAFYAFCRIVDDIADEPAENPVKELDFWKKEVGAVFNGSPQTDLGKDLQRVIEKYPLEKEYFDLLIEGMEMDLAKTEYPDFAALEKYIYRVAGVVGLACIEIFGYKNAKTREYALLLASAVQMTNIIRDIYEDAAIGRVYIPRGDMLKFNIDGKDITDGNYTKLLPLIKHEISVARDFYKKAAAALPPEDKKSMFPSRVMGAVYEAVLDKIEKTPGFKEKIRLSKTEKIKAVLGVALGKK